MTRLDSRRRPMRGREVLRDLPDHTVPDYSPTTEKEVIIEG